MNGSWNNGCENIGGSVLINFLISILLLYGILMLLSLRCSWIAKVIWFPFLIVTFKILELKSRKKKQLTLISFGVAFRFFAILILILISGILILLILYLVIFVGLLFQKNEDLNVISFVSEGIKNNSADIILILIMVLFYSEYRLYKKLITILSRKKFFNLISAKELLYLKKHLLADFTVLIVYLGVFPILIDNLFAGSNFIDDMKSKLLFFLLSSAVPYTHLVYKYMK